MRKSIVFFAMVLLPVLAMAQAQLITINYPLNRYEARHLILNEPYYVDKDYLLTRIDSEIDRYLWLRTWNADQYDENEEFLSFTLRDSMTIYVAYDYRCWDPPFWLENEFRKTDKYISVNDGIVKSYYLWKKSFPPGEVILGGNRAGGRGTSSRGMYLVIFATKSAEVPAIVSPQNGATIVYSTMTQFMWRTADAALNYYLKISTSSSNSGVIHSKWGITDTTYTYPGLGPDQTYYWAIQAENETSKSGFTGWNRFTLIPGEPPHANFTATPTSGSAPLFVQFTNLSTGTYTNLIWDFGDGQSSTATHPGHTYASVGDYTVILSIAGDLGSDQMIKTEYITVVQKPVADFVGSPVSGPSPLQVSFSDRSSGSINSRLWMFGDGATSTEQNPVHVYQNPGVYTVTLQVAGPGGTDTKTAASYVHCLRKPTAQFSGTPLTGHAPLQVTFTDLSQGDYDTRTWHFGDGATGTEVNPVHDYTSPGLYTVTLVVNGAAGSDVMTKSNYVNVSESPNYIPPSASFTAIPLSGQKPLQVQFTNLSIGDITSVHWDFGDGQTSTLFNATHTYTEIGFFSVRLIVMGPAGCDTLAHSNYIQVTDEEARTVQVSIPTMSMANGNPCNVPIHVSDCVGKEIISYEFTLNYDPAILVAVGISTLNTISAPFIMPYADFSQSGKVQVGNFGVNPLNQDGILINIQFNVIGNPGESCSLDFSNFKFNGGDPAAITSAGKFTVTSPTGLMGADEQIVKEFDLSGGYPNPFNGSVRFDLQIAKPSDIKVYIVDRVGRKIRTLCSGRLSAGRHAILWDGKNEWDQLLPSGIYMVVSEYGHFRRVTKVALIQ